MRGLPLALALLVVATGAARAESGRASFFSARGMTCAHRSLPIGSRVRVTNMLNHRSTILTVSGRGPFVRGRIVDVSTAAAGLLGFRRAGVVPVDVVAQR